MRKEFHMPTDKKSTIRDAAMTEFIRKGYEAASTNNIVRRAGISKGSLFHYFGSKEKLFRSLFTMAQEEIATAVLAAYEEEKARLPDTPLERILFLAESEFGIMQNKPRLHHFLSWAAGAGDGSIEHRLIRDLLPDPRQILSSLMQPFKPTETELRILFYALEGIKRDLEGAYREAFEGMRSLDNVIQTHRMELSALLPEVLKHWKSTRN